MVDPIEAVADAIMYREGWYPGYCSYKNRNPGNLRAVFKEQDQDSRGFRIFPGLIVGYAALLDDLLGKFTGHNTHGLGPDSTLLEMIEVYAPRADRNDPLSYALCVSRRLTSALGRPISTTSRLREIAPDLHYDAAPGVDTATGIA